MVRGTVFKLAGLIEGNSEPSVLVGLVPGVDFDEQDDEVEPARVVKEVVMVSPLAGIGTVKTVERYSVVSGDVSMVVPVIDGHV
jgi:hypothetical protein